MQAAPVSSRKRRANGTASGNQATNEGLPIAEIFAGVGSVAIAFAQRGFRPVYLNDVDALARDTFLANSPWFDGEYALRDTRDVTARDLRRRARNVIGLLGCPPCQGWSAAGRRASNDLRNRLIGEFFRLVQDTSPVFFVMENVPAVASRPELERALKSLATPYRWWSGVLNAACYGLPQSRQRTLVVGYRGDVGVQPTPPRPSHAGTRPLWDYRTEKLVVPTAETVDALLGAAPRLAAGGSQHTTRWLYEEGLDGLEDFVTVGDAIADLDRSSEDGEPSAFARALGAGTVSSPSSHVPWRHGTELRARLRRVREGRRPPVSATNGRRYYSQAYARLHRDGLARTITTNFHNPGSGRFLHYRRHRTLTVREAARLQGFRDDFTFFGHLGAQARLVGNAFPPLWAEAIARHVSDELADALARA